MTVNGISYGEIAERAFGIFREMRESPAFPLDRYGGYLTIMERNSGRVLLTVPVGTCAKPKVKAYRDFSIEKADRVFGNPTHISSWETRNESEQKYGGAIVAGDLILSFSGFPEHWDETLVLTLAARHGWITRDEAEAITKISDNQIFWGFNQAA